MKTLVAYFSRTGCTKKVAEAIYSQVEGDKEIRDAGEIKSLDDYDLVFFGFPIEQYGPSQQPKDFLAQYCGGRKLALFVTHAAPEDMPIVEPWMQACREAAAGADLVGVFDCQGELAAVVAEHLMASGDPQLQAFGRMAPMTKGQPDESRLERARLFAKEIMKTVFAAA